MINYTLALIESTPVVIAILKKQSITVYVPECKWFIQVDNGKVVAKFKRSKK